MRFKKSKGLILGLGIFLYLCASPIPSQAAGSVSVSPDKESIGIGEEVTVQIKASKPSDPTEPTQISVEYDTNFLTFQSCSTGYGGGGGGLITLSDTSASIQFKAVSVGNTTIDVSAVIDGDGASIPTDSSKISIAGSSDKNQSSDASLAAFSVSPGILSPAFSPDITSYTLSVPNDTETVMVSCTPRDKDAQITGVTGFSKLNVGENHAQIKVLAKNGEMKQYHIDIIREEALEEKTVRVEEGRIPLADSTLSIVREFGDDVIPQGFVKTQYDYNGESIQAAKLAMGDLILFYFTDGSGQGIDFYIYHPETNAFSDFVKIDGIEGRFIVPLPADESIQVPEGFTRANIQWGGKTVEVWIPLVDTAKGETVKKKGLKNIYAGIEGVMRVYAEEGQTDTPEGAAGEPGDGGTPEEGTPQEGAQGETPQEEPAGEASAGEQGSGGTEFFMLYAMSSEGNKGLYLYDSTEGTYQRYFGMGGGDGTSLGKDFKSIASIRLIIIGVMGVAILALVVALLGVIMIGRRGQGKRERVYRSGREPKPARNLVYDEEEDSKEELDIYDDYDDDMEQMRKRVAAKEKSAIKRERKALNFLIDTEDEDEEITEVEVPSPRPMKREQPERETLQRKPKQVRQKEPSKVSRPRPVSSTPSTQSTGTRKTAPARTSTRTAPVRTEAYEDRPVKRVVKKEQGKDVVRTQRPVRVSPQETGTGKSLSKEGQSRLEPQKRPVKKVKKKPNLDEDFEFEYLNLDD